MAAFFSVLFLRGLVPLLLGLGGPLVGRNYSSPSLFSSSSFPFFILIFFLTPSLRQLTEWSLDPLDEALDLIVDALKPPELRQNVWERN